MFLEFETDLDPQLAQMLALAENFVRDIHAGKEPRYWLSFLGTSGAGKTMLTEAIIQWAKRYHIDRVDKQASTPSRIVHKQGGLLTWGRCCQMMLEGDYGWVQQAKNDWILAIDDIGAEYDKIKALTVSKLYDILNARRGKWTVITANLSVEQIAKQLDGRIASRLFRDNGEVIEVKTQDYNIRKFNQRKAR